jgi:hypothetical protein
VVSGELRACSAGPLAQESTDRIYRSDRIRKQRLCLFIPAAVILMLALWTVWSMALMGGHTWLELTDARTGRGIFAQALQEGEEIVLTWKNSLFGLMVTEVFTARGGRLDLTQVTFADPLGGEPPLARPEDLDDLYHTGGPFRVEGLSRPVTRLVFRVGEIGNPRLTIGPHTIHMVREVHFGGGVQLLARSPGLADVAGVRWLRRWLWNAFPPRHNPAP